MIRVIGGYGPGPVSTGKFILLVLPFLCCFFMMFYSIKMTKGATKYKLSYILSILFMIISTALFLLWSYTVISLISAQKHPCGNQNKSLQFEDKTNTPLC